MKLHLGCGKRIIPGFVHVDRLDFAHIQQRTSLSDLSFAANGSAELIYCAHAFEYFDREEAPKVLQEWHRVLRPSGLLRLAVPDFSVLAELYRDGLALDKILGPLYGKIPSDDGFQFHKTCYDFASLEIILHSSGFKNVRRYDWRTTEHANVDDFSQAYIPHMDKERGRLISLNVEAERA